jgi:hypothetical protein
MNTQRKVWWLSHRLHQLTNDIEAARFTAGYGAFDVAGIWERVDEMKEEFALALASDKVRLEYDV